MLMQRYKPEQIVAMFWRRFTEQILFCRYDGLEFVAQGLMPPQEWYADIAYMSGRALTESEAMGRQIWGPAQPAPIHGISEFTSDQFWIEVETRRAVCLAGKESTQCSQLQVGQTGAVIERNSDLGRKPTG